MKQCPRCGEVKPYATEFYHTSKRSQCKKCEREKDRKKYDRPGVRNRHLTRAYGLSLVEYTVMLADQNLCCGICGRYWPDDETVNEWPVDHNHVTKKIRGILCHPCNMALGLFGDNPETVKRALEWLEK